jgi:hypothetical protein
MLIEQENRALVDELVATNRSARGVESTMRELATLNQMFSTQVCTAEPPAPWLHGCALCLLA